MVHIVIYRKYGGKYFERYVKNYHNIEPVQYHLNAKITIKNFKRYMKNYNNIELVQYHLSACVIILNLYMLAHIYIVAIIEGHSHIILVLRRPPRA